MTATTATTTTTIQAIAGHEADHDLEQDAGGDDQDQRRASSFRADDQRLLLPCPQV